MYVYTPMDLPVHLLQKIKKDNQKRKEKLSFHKKRWRKKKKQLTEDAKFEETPNESFDDDDYLEYNDDDDNFNYENSDDNFNTARDLNQSAFESNNNNAYDFLDDQDILILKTLLNLKFSLPDLASPQPFIESTYQLINENIFDSMKEITDQVDQIKNLMEKTESQVQNSAKINQQILEKTQNFKVTMKKTHQNMKVLGNAPLFHRILFKLQDLYSFFAPYFYRIYEYVVRNLFNSKK